MDWNIPCIPPQAACLAVRGNAKRFYIVYLFKAKIKDIEINPEFGEAYNSSGLVKLELKDFIGAIADFTKTI